MDRGAAGDDVLVARNGDTVLVINMGEDEAQLSGLGSVLIASGDVVKLMELFRFQPIPLFGWDNGAEFRLQA